MIFMRNRDFAKFHLELANARDIDTIINICSTSFFLNVLSSPNPQYRSTNPLRGYCALVRNSMAEELPNHFSKRKYAILAKIDDFHEKSRFYKVSSLARE